MVTATTRKPPAKSLSPGGDSKKCLVPDCARKAVRRGCCAACMAAFYREVRAKKITWKKLIDRGLVLPCRPGKRSPAGNAIRKLNKDG